MPRGVRTRTGIIVTGMHRSGTSATTRLINLLGAEIATDLVPAREGDNDRGFWEAAEVVDIDDALLAGLGLGYDSHDALPDHWEEQPAASEARVRIESHIAGNFEAAKTFVVKDPRIARLLPVWLAAWRAARIKPLLVICVRNPVEIAASLKQRNGFPAGHSLLLYLRHMTECERHSRGVPRIFSSFDDLLSNWRGLERGLRAAKTLRLPALTADTSLEIESFLDSRLHRNKLSDPRDFGSAEIPGLVVRTHQALIKACSGGDSAELRRTFDEISGELAEATRLFSDSFAWSAGQREAAFKQAWERHAATTTAQAREIADLRAQLRAAADVRTHALAAVEAVSTDKVRLGERAIVQRDALMAEKASQLRVAHAELEKLRKELVEYQRTIEELDEAKRQIAEREQAVQELDRVKQQLTECERAIVDNETEQLRLASTQAEEVMQQLADRERVLQHALASVEEKERVNATLSKQNTRLFEEAVQLRADRARLAGELEQARQQLADRERAAAALQDRPAVTNGAADANANANMTPARKNEGNPAEAALDASQSDVLSDLTRRLRRLREGHANGLTAPGTAAAGQSGLAAAALEELAALEQAIRDERSRFLERERTGTRRLERSRKRAEELESALAAIEQEVAQVRSRFVDSKRRIGTLQGALATTVREDPSLRYYILGRAGLRRLDGSLSLLRGAGTARKVAASGLFDVAWYLEANPDVAGHPDPLEHYLRFGGREGRSPSPLFDSAWYLRTNPDVAASGLNPLVHYVVHGAAEGRDPHPLFRTSHYVATARLEGADAANALAHYLRSGPENMAAPHPLFDPDWYVRSFQPFGQVDEPPLLHYLRFGKDCAVSPHPLFDEAYARRASGDSCGAALLAYAAAGAEALFDPHPLFRNSHYREALGAPLERGTTPLEHHLRLGPATSPHPLFDAAWYQARHGDAADASMAPLLDYVKSGGVRDPHWIFNTAYYLAKRDPVRSTPLVDYVLSPRGKVPSPNPWFDGRWYMAQNRDVDDSGVEPLEHYVCQGRFAGLAPHPKLHGMVLGPDGPAPIGG